MQFVLRLDKNIRATFHRWAKKCEAMPPKNLVLSIESYDIGPKIRKLRKKKNLGLVKLGQHTGMSAGLLSRIERGRLVPTLPTLLKIATVFSVGLDYFFNGASERATVAVVRRQDRLRLPNRTDGGAPAYFFESLDFPVTNRKMDTYFAEFRARARPTEPHAHLGAEIIYVIGGELVININGQNQMLSEGDSIYFDSSYPHSYRNHGEGVCSAIVVVTS